MSRKHCFKLSMETTSEPGYAVPPPDGFERIRDNRLNAYNFEHPAIYGFYVTSCALVMQFPAVVMQVVAVSLAGS